MTKLEELLKKIHPENLHDDIVMKIDNAVTQYISIESNTVDLYDECEQILAEFYRAVSGVIEGEITKPRNWRDAGKAMDLLKSKYGSWDNVSHLMQSGLEGGVYGVINSLKNIMTLDYCQKITKGLILQYWYDLDSYEKENAYKEYISIFGYLLNNETKEFLWREGVFLKTLEEHPMMLKKLNR